MHLLKRGEMRKLLALPFVLLQHRVWTLIVANNLNNNWTSATALLLITVNQFVSKYHQSM